MNQTPLDRAIVEAGSGVALASVIGVTPMAVSHWRVRGVPAHQVLAIESATGVSRYDLRPDIYPRQSLTLNVNLRAIALERQSDESAVNPSSALKERP